MCATTTDVKTDLIRELQADIESLMSLRDNHLSHAAAVVRALVQKRIESSQAAIDRAAESTTTNADDELPPVAFNDEGEPCCAFCDRTDLRYVEDIQNWREVNGMDEGVFFIDAHYETGEGYDDGENGRLACPSCCAEFAMPTCPHAFV